MESFSKGFTQGFGLISDAKNNKARLDLARDSLNIRNTERSADLSYRGKSEDNRLEAIKLNAEQRKEDARIREEAAIRQDGFREAERIRQSQVAENTLKYRSDTATATSNYRSDLLDPTKNPELKLKMDQSKVLFDKQNQLAQDQIDLTNKNKAAEVKRLQIIEAGNASDQLLKFEYPEGGLSPESAGVFNQYVAQANNGVLSISGALNQFNPEVAENLNADVQSFLQTGELTSKDGILGGANIIISKNTKGIGEVIPMDKEGVESKYPNVPLKYRTGTWKIVDKEAHEIRNMPDGSLGIDVLVVLQDNEGNIGKYVAPVTEGRENQGLAVSMKPDDLISGFAGMMHYSKEMAKNKENLYAGLREMRYRDDNGDYDHSAYTTAYQEAEIQFNELLPDREQMKVMQGSNKTFGEINQNQKEKKAYIQHQLLTGNSIPISYRDESAGEIAETRGARAVSLLETQRKRVAAQKGEDYAPFTDSQMYEIRTYMGQDTKGNLEIDDRNGFVKWKRANNIQVRTGTRAMGFGLFGNQIISAQTP